MKETASDLAPANQCTKHMCFEPSAIGARLTVCDCKGCSLAPWGSI